MRKWKLIIVVIVSITTACKKNEPSETVANKKKKAITNLVKHDTTCYSVQEAMEINDLKGLSVAVIEDYKISWTETWGIKDVESSEIIDKNTAFSAASIAKPITATLSAILEEKGLIDLKAPVANYLKRWKLPESEFLIGNILTLEHLLSHTAGTTQHGFDDYYLGDTIPTLVQSLQGQIPDYDEEIEFLWTPGTNWSYSGGGYVIVQVAIEDHLGKSLADLSDEYLFKPLGMKNTTLKQPNEEGFLTNVAKAHNENGEIVGTGLPITPQVAPSGLWSTPTDLSIFLIEIQNALRNKNNKVISNNVAIRVTKIVTSKVLGGWSLGWERRHGFGNYEWFSHGGANTGVGGHIYTTMEGGKGIVLLGNSANNNRIPVIDQFRNSIIKSHDWYLPLGKSQEKPLPEELIEMVTGKYLHTLFGEEVEVASINNKLFIKNLISNNITELTFIGDNTFLVDEYVRKIKFERKHNDNVMYISMIRNKTNEKIFGYKKME